MNTKKVLKNIRNGNRFKLNVDPLFRTKDDPATEIIGKTSYNVIMSGDPMMNGSAGTGYERGQRVKVTMGTSNFVITFWECVEAHGESYNLHTEAT